MAIAPAERVRSLSGEGAFEVLVASRRLENDGQHVVHLEIGEPDRATPHHVVEAGVRAPHPGNTRERGPARLPPPRDATPPAPAVRACRGGARWEVAAGPA